MLKSLVSTDWGFFAEKNLEKIICRITFASDNHELVTMIY